MSPPPALLRSPEAPLKRKELGALGEKAARAFLEKRGYKVLEANFRSREGEIDLIALQREVVVFAEVKARTSHALGTPQEAVTPRKLERIKNLALEYLATHPNLPPDWRIDVLALDMDAGGRIKSLDLIENAGGW